MEKLWQQLKEKHNPYAALLELCIPSTVPAACVETVHTGGDLS